MEKNAKQIYVANLTMICQNNKEHPFTDLYADFCRYRYEGRNPLWSEGFWILAIYRLGRLVLMMRNPTVRLLCLFPVAVLRKILASWLGITIPFSVKIGAGFYLPHFGAIFIHDDVIIGHHCAVYQAVTLGARGSKRGAPRVGNFVNIGSGAQVLGSIIIGDYVDIGANAVVIEDVPDHSIAVGVPATVKPRQQREMRIFA